MTAVDGTYEVKITAPIGGQTVKMVFMTEGSTLTGTVIGKEGTTEIRDGRAQDNEFEFKAEIKLPLGKSEAGFKGSIEGDEVKGFLTTMLGSVPMKGHRLEGE
jgi:hypothetical protein